MKIKKIIKQSLLLCFFASLLLTSCGHVALYNDLSQEDANKVIVLLQQNGMEASLSKEVRQNEIFWSIKVPQESLVKARELIVTSNVISPRAPGLKEVYQGKGGGGWIRTPAEERARYLLALKGEIINSLKKIPDVVDVDVVLNVPEEEKLGETERKRPTASVVIKVQHPARGQPSSLNELKVQEFVANSVKGMSARDVSALIHFVAPTGTTLRPGETITLPKGGVSPVAKEEGKEAMPLQLMGLKLDYESRERLKLYLIIFFAVLMILSVGLIVIVISASRQRQELKALKGGEGKALEGQVLEGEVPRLRGKTQEEPKE